MQLDQTFRVLTENSVDVLCRIGLDLSIRYMSPSCLKVLGWPQEELAGRCFEALVVQEDRPLLRADVALAMNAPPEQEPSSGVVMRTLRKDGTIAWIEGRGKLLRNPVSGAPEEFIAVLRDANERVELEAHLRAMAHTDGLTGLSNRRAFDEALKREWRRAMREGWPLSLLLIDLDHFKRFNDRYGHHPGDECLRVVASVLKTTVRRGGDVAARYGGEEMALILPATAEAGADGVAAQVLGAVRALGIRHEQNPEGGGCVTVSVGAATVLFRGGSRPAQLEDLVVAADQALYFAKREGRNRVSAVTIVAPRE